MRHRRFGSGCRWAARTIALTLLIAPAAGHGLEPRYDHRDQQGPTVEALYVRDVFWRGSVGSSAASRGAVRAAWGFDPTGDGDELLFGAAYTALEGDATGSDRLSLVLDARYRAFIGTEHFKTLFDVGLWGSAANRVAAGPLVGLGFIYDFSRNVGVLASGSLAAGIGQRRVVSFGGGVGIQVRYE